ncbi:MAG: DUF3037 domain-containing protein [Muribaculaceae bacterium]|nr:DUF3037 domain-containing protein [Muribaculaceae bacterium]
MQSKHEKNLYEYAVIRFIPKVERGEFINVGLVMMCKRRRWLQVRILLDEKRIYAIFGDVDIELLRRQLQSFEAIAEGRHSPIGDLDAHERFRWLTAVRSACIDTSRPHAGLTEDLDLTFDMLFKEQVVTP